LMTKMGARRHAPITLIAVGIAYSLVFGAMLNLSRMSIDTPGVHSHIVDKILEDDRSSLSLMWFREMCPVILKPYTDLGLKTICPIFN